ncbi:MAG TPA: DUF4124 domain-containing protein [Burkholderiaceae bacterium]|nr:DUF4124 domain-containing protein [Burkholderiaceae bacterium]
MTVSIAADTSGMFSAIRRVRRVFREASRGRISEKAGTSRTSSNVSAFFASRMGPSGTKINYTGRPAPARRAVCTCLSSAGRRRRGGRQGQSDAPPLRPSTAMRQPCRPNRSARLLFAAAGLLLAVPALAGNWQWRDAAGRMVYSDQPPPPSVPISQILRSPTPAQDAGPTATAPAAAAATATVAPASRSWIEKEQASRKRTLERAETERNQGTEREQAARNARACEDAQTTLRTLESGLRMSFVDANGEQQVLDDAERARRTEAVRQEIARSCSKAG